MMDATLPGTRSERRQRIAIERKARASGDWGSWERISLPHGLPTRQSKKGWTSEVRSAAKNNLYCVLIRPMMTDWGEVFHCAITSISAIEPPWRDKQRIKDELFGEKFTAVEVMPPRDQIVDGADMYHIWVFARALPFSIWSGT